MKLTDGLGQHLVYGFNKPVPEFARAAAGDLRHSGPMWTMRGNTKQEFNSGSKTCSSGELAKQERNKE